ncbi:hypothetical protein BDDG_12174 [Blastomyces dermatitidis ATCC 18188]|uniref:Heme haloperoxidase family profile domain-containing protein n=1 Tax=Ajellomyces dermatitidis (strain ATCC 18188 / CBS 674.68) TaxID=653446 RepID=A0A0J9EMJ3_AJEDA|nr:hypothetical protein BDDG_12174 [Blastomyces dermatitidis ATCC 18188]
MAAVTVASVVSFSSVYAAADYARWRPPGPGDVRGPCPALNSLANHGILPHNGKRMTYPTLLEGISEGLNVGFDLTLVAGTGGMIGAKNPLQLYFNLDDLANHDLFAEHDASLSRSDIFFGDNNSFNETIWQSVLDYFRHDETVSFLAAAKARLNRIKTERVRNPDFTFNAKDVVISYTETAQYLSVFGNPDTGHPQVDWIRIFFEQERLPYDEGWERPSKQTNAVTLAPLVAKLMVAGGQIVPEAYAKVVAEAGADESMLCLVTNKIPPSRRRNRSRTDSDSDIDRATTPKAPFGSFINLTRNRLTFAMEVLHNPPEASSFIPLAEHQSHTPVSFYSGPPILHHLSERCKIVILERELSKSAALSGLRPSVTGAEAVNGTPVGETSVSATAPAAASSDREKEIVIDGIDVWVTSERLLLYSQPSKTGVTIPYPSISLHAIQRLQIPNSNPLATPSTGDENTVQGLYMQLATDSNDNQEDEDMEEGSICLTIVPPPPPPQPQPQPQAQEQQQQQQQQEDNLITTEEEENKPSQTPTQDLFAAVSACSNLHPDPPSQPGSDDEGDTDMQDNPTQQLDSSILYQNGVIIPGNNAGGLPPAMPGSGGWITAENVHEYFDEEGNWKGGDGNEGEQGEGSGGVSLGPGAGTVRPREEGGEDNARVGCEADAGEGGEETKWRRTG